MKYVIVFSIAPENIKAAKERFKEPEPLDGIKQTRWHELGTAKGFTFIETDDVIALSKLMVYWSDLVDLKIVQVIGDEEMGEALGG